MLSIVSNLNGEAVKIHLKQGNANALRDSYSTPEELSFLMVELPEEFGNRLEEYLGMNPSATDIGWLMVMDHEYQTESLFNIWLSKKPDYRNASWLAIMCRPLREKALKYYNSINPPKDDVELTRAMIEEVG